MKRNITINGDNYYLIDSGWYNGSLYLLYENELYGDEIPAVVCTVYGYFIDRTFDSLNDWACEYFN